jgi:hypothetical protein
MWTNQTNNFGESLLNPGHVVAKDFEELWKALKKD